ncbi:hypothetical protein SH580_06175 [Coraliomargarita algicola]|uniref:Uncharacterized protein n=1 Tax=Coraliomargarita algicola TaxID=3092156 RepID=A0ABZ0RPG2_9BACT|nr:hypothetical protein [Coraliomargarita sp. J2-16]WPJ97293.1 hypothetical protein SH580_06175 [Coraliomargarita sp. J2-16]
MGGDLKLVTTDYDDIEQHALIRSGATMAAGEEALLTMAQWPVSGSGDDNNSYGQLRGGHSSKRRSSLCSAPYGRPDTGWQADRL